MGSYGFLYGTLPEIDIAPENGCLQDDPFLLGWPIVRGELFVLGRVDVFLLVA